jgi:hypothetical protein
MAEHDTNSEFLDTLAQVKDAIGEWHDWEDLLATAQKALEHGSNCSVLRELKERSNEKYDYALRSAENLRRKYLQIARVSRKQRRKLPRPVSTAIAQMAA